MGKCKFCGLNAGFLSDEHRECRCKYDNAIKKLDTLFMGYLVGKLNISEIKTDLLPLRQSSFVKKNDAIQSLSKISTDYLNNIRRIDMPITFTKIKSLVNGIGLQITDLNDDVVGLLADKIIRFYLTEYFTNNMPMSQTIQMINNIVSIIPVKQERLNDDYWYVLNKAATNFLNDGLLTDKEEKLVNEYVSKFNLSLVAIPDSSQYSEIEKLSQSAILKNIQNGIIPKTFYTVPVMLSTNETVLWVYNNVTMYQEKIQRETVGKHGGFSFRICKGVTYRTGQFNGKPIEHSYMDNIGTGSLYVTNKNVFFHCNTNTTKIPYSKIIGVTPYSDGIEIHKDGNSKRVLFTGFDSWFIMNTMSLINV